MISTNYQKGFTKSLVKKLTKTKDGRQGDLLYNRRNSRGSRVLIQYEMFKKLEEDHLNKYERGYVVVLTPKEYFESKNTPKTDLDPRIELGKNAIVYYQLDDEDWNNLPIHKDWMQVVEKSSAKDDWTGHFAVNITNANETKKSFIVRKEEDKDHKSFSWMNKKMKKVNRRVEKGLGGKGLGNYDFDYCDEDTLEKTLFQLAYYFWKMDGIDDFLNDEYNAGKGFGSTGQKNKDNLTKTEFKDWLKKSKKKVEEYVKKHNLNDEKKLEKSRIFRDGKVVCPLCLQPMKAKDLTSVIEQDLGRSSAGQTITSIVLLHIDPLRPGKFNHRPFNLGWGHKWCNTIQENLQVDETLIQLAEILKSNDWNVNEPKK